MLALSVLVVTCFASSTIAASIPDKTYYVVANADLLFKDFVKQYKKSYTGNEYLERLEIFKKNLEDINSQNDKHPYTSFKVNQFADLSPEERQQYLGMAVLNTTAIKKVTIPDSGIPAPSELDWRNKGVVSHVKTQGQCGSCFIFSAIGNIEGQYAIKHQECLALSEGQALDCTQAGGCNGGMPDVIMQQLTERAGVMLEQDYPYAYPKSDCKEDPSRVKVRVLGGGRINIPDENVLMQKLADIGPLAVTMNSADMHFYYGGLMYPDKCKGKQLDHAVVLVGYGEDSGTPYWIIKNSWGEGWGENGYVRLVRGVNACVMGTSFTGTVTVA